MTKTTKHAAGGAKATKTTAHDAATEPSKTVKAYGKWGRAVPVRFGKELRDRVDAFCEKHGLAASEIVRAAVPHWLDAVKHDASLIPAKEEKPAREKKPREKKTKSEKIEKLAKAPKSEAKPLGTSKAKKSEKSDASSALKFPKKPAKAAKSAPADAATA